MQQGRRYWFDDEENARIIEQNGQFQQVCNYEKMIELTYLPPEETPLDAKPIFLQDIMHRLANDFPAFVITKNADMELGRRLVRMGYKQKHMTKGSTFRLKER